LVTKEKPAPILKKSWIASIGMFLMSQVIFITMETTGWKPNYRDIDGTLFGKIANSSIFSEWFTMYETLHFNVLTVFFTILFLVPGMIGAMKHMFFTKCT
jgi:YfzA-like protein